MRDLDRLEIQVDDLLTKGDLAIGSGVVYLRTPALRSLTLLQKEIGGLRRKTLRPSQKISLKSPPPLSKNQQPFPPTSFTVRLRFTSK